MPVVAEPKTERVVSRRLMGVLELYRDGEAGGAGGGAIVSALWKKHRACIVCSTTMAPAEEVFWVEGDGESGFCHRRCATQDRVVSWDQVVLRDDSSVQVLLDLKERVQDAREEAAAAEG